MDGKEGVMKKLILFTILISAVTAGSFWGSERLCMRMRAQDDFRFGADWYAQLGLNKEEAGIFRKEDAVFRKETNRMCMELCKQRMELLDLLSRNAGESKISQKMDSVGALQTALEKNMVKHILEIKSKLPGEKGKVYLAHLRQQLEKSINQCVYEK